MKTVNLEELIAEAAARQAAADERFLKWDNHEDYAERNRWRATVKWLREKL